MASDNYSVLLIVLVAISALWALVAVVVLAACRAAARADAELAAEDEAVALAGPMGWLLSEAFAGKYVADRPQQDLYVPPERPVRDVEVVHRAHLA
jgi:hypothetical protein